MDVTEFARTEWEQLRSSKTFKALVAMETAAVSLFVQQVLAGEQKTDLASLRGWLVVQAVIVLAALVRHTLAGIEAKLDGSVDPATVRAISASAEKRLVEAVKGRDPALGGVLEQHLASSRTAEPEPPARNGDPS